MATQSPARMEWRAVALLRGREDPLPTSPSPGPGCWHLQTAQQPFPWSPLEAPRTDSHPQLTSIPLEVLLFPPLPSSPNTEVCFEVETVSGLIETRPPESPAPTLLWRFL